MRKGLLVLLWFPLTFIMLLANMALLAASSIWMHEGGVHAQILSEPDTAQVAASSGTSQILGATVTAGDAREELLSQFLSQYHSPLQEHAATIVQEADKNGIDFRLVPAIAMCESNLGKRVPSRDSFNAWGIAVYTGTKEGAKFRNWAHAISWVSNYIKSHYYDRGIVDLKDIGAIWAPPSVNTGYSWTSCVQTFRDSIL